MAFLGWTGLDEDAQDLNGFPWLDWIGLDKDALTLLCLVKNGCTELSFLLENDAQRPWIRMAG